MRIIFLLKILTIVDSAKQKQLPSDRKYTVTQINLVCSDKTRIHLDKCFIRAKRGTHGLINFLTRYENVNDINIDIKLFYRSSAGKYQPFIIDLIFDMCSFVNAAKWNFIIKTGLELIVERFDKTITEGCPLKGPMNITDWDPDADIERFLFVKVLPEGIFEFRIRAFDAKNVTYYRIKNTFSIRANGMQDSIRMG